jgi:hypothetical protein
MAKLHTLVDRFSTLNTAVWTPTGTGVQTVGGRLMLVADGDFETLETVGSYDLTASYFSWQWTIPAVAGSDQSYVTIRSNATRTDSTNEIVLTTFQNNMTIYVRNNGVEVSEALGVYDPAVYGTWFRVRNTTGTTVVVESSFNGVTWTQRGTSKTVTWDMTSAVVFLVAGGFNGQPYYFDNINYVPQTYFGGENIVDMYVGGTIVTAAYLGTVKVWG